MKLLKKILVVILSVAMIFTAFPFAAFADRPDPEVILTPRPDPDWSGRVEKGKITITISTDALSDLFRSFGTDEFQEKLTALLNMEGNLITLEDIFEIVPFEAILGVLIGEDHRGLGRLIKELGGVDVMREMVDEQKIITSILEGDEQDREDFFEIIRQAVVDGDLDGIETALYPNAVLQLNIPINYEALYEYIDFSKIREKFAALSFAEKREIFTDFDGFVNALVAGLDGTLKKNDGTTPLEPGDLLEVNSTNAEAVGKIVTALIELDASFLADVLADVVAAGYDIPGDVYEVKVEKVKSILDEDAAFKTSLFDRILNPEPGKPIITEAGMAALSAWVVENGNVEITAADLEFILENEDYLDIDVVKSGAPVFLTDTGIRAVLQIPGLTPTPAQIAALYNEHPEYFDTETLKSAVTIAGLLRLLNLEDLVNVLAEDADGSLGYYDRDVILAAITPEGEAAFRAAFQPSLEHQFFHQ